MSSLNLKNFNQLPKRVHVSSLWDLSNICFILALSVFMEHIDYIREIFKMSSLDNLYNLLMDI